MTRLSLHIVVAALATACFPTRVTGLNFFGPLCFFELDRCFLFIGTQLHQGTPGTTDCVEKCAFFTLLHPGWSCGGCGDIIITRSPTSASPASIAPVTQAPVTVTPVSVPPVSSAPVPSAPVSSAPVSATPVSAAPIPSSPVSSAPVSNTPVYDITLSYDSSVPTDDRPIFTAAAARWEAVITGDLPSEDSDGNPFTVPNIDFGCTPEDTIDDIFVCVRYAPIDGVNNVIGQGGFIWVRTDTFLPIVGNVTIDSADVDDLKANSKFYQLVLEHELGHVLGFGSVWDDNGLVGSPPACLYSGTDANREYQTISQCTTSVPIDAFSTSCGGHWDENCLQNELMTPTLTQGLGFFVPNPLSTITIGALQDMGYTVNYTAADAFDSDDLNASCDCNRRRRSMLNGAYKPVEGTHRKLSEDLRQYAIKYGKSELERRKPSFAMLLERGAEPALTYMGDKLITVLVKEGDSVFTVVVTN